MCQNPSADFSLRVPLFILGFNRFSDGKDIFHYFKLDIAELSDFKQKRQISHTCFSPKVSNRGQKKTESNIEMLLK